MPGDFKRPLHRFREGMDTKKIGKANERKGKVKRGKDEEVNGQGGRGVPRLHTGRHKSGQSPSYLGRKDVV